LFYIQNFHLINILIHWILNAADGVEKVQCNYCNAKLSCVLSAGKTHIRQHADQCLINIDSGASGPSKQGRLSFIGSSLTTSNWIWTFSQEKTQEGLVRMIIQHKYPFSIVEHQGFIDFMRSAQPSFVMPGRKTIHNDGIKIFNTMKAQQIQRIAKANRIALTTNLWTASDLMGYMVVTAHYINNNWNLIKKIIGFQPLPPPHTGKSIADCVTQTLLDWNAVRKVAFFTLDNASSNNLAISQLQQFLNN
jgi:hypothetical protein